METRLGQSFQAFRKIPYAEPPIDELRFVAPVPKKPWQDILNCTAFGPMCMQEDQWNGKLLIDENCLHLNVFTRTLPSNEQSELKPVIVYLHGGGFEFGSAIDHGPAYLLDRDIVLVTVAYRLGTFGFMAVETAEIPGNAGLKDQNLAFKWVQKNIKYFSGDPGQVTIAGLSAGGYSATGHIVSPMSKGLFKNVIAMSGALAWQMPLKENNIEVVKGLAAKVNCPTNTTTAMVQCLRNVSGSRTIFNF